MRFYTAKKSTGGATVFTDLTDVPNSYVGQGGKVAKVNAGESGLEMCGPLESLDPHGGSTLSTGLSTHQCRLGSGRHHHDGSAEPGRARSGR